MTISLHLFEACLHAVECVPSELKIEGTPVYLDVEGLPDRDFYYLIGVRIGNGESAVQHTLWADSVDDEKRIYFNPLRVAFRDGALERVISVEFDRSTQ